MKKLYLFCLIGYLCANPAIAQTIVQLEYFIDSDLESGSRTIVDITPGATVTKGFTVSLAGQPDGLHTLYVRAKDSNGNWSFAVSRPFYKIAATSI
jgi:hypothetical protein